MPKKPDANTIIDTIAATPALDNFFKRAPALVTTDDIMDVVAHYRRERVAWLEGVKKKMEKKSAKDELSK